MGRKSVEKTRNTNKLKHDKYVALLTQTFKEHGLKKYTMDLIAEELNVSKATLYHYFSSKDDMVTAILNNVILQMSGFRTITKNKKISYEKRFYLILELFSASIADISTVLLADLQEDYPLLWNEVQKFIEYVTDVLTSFYDEGKKEGVFSTIETSILVASDRMFFNIISDIDFLKKNKITIKTAFDEYYKLKCYGFIKLS